ncbi:MAG: nucleoside triphosphate pyrophosphohydrolase [Enterobacterales bacterium]|nr:nucleoside triphosphate pyrophosphohydrolase [Enterobacterales bacterium]
MKVLNSPTRHEEVYEIIDAIESKDFDGLKSELGDLLFLVIFYAQLAKEDQYFDLNDVIEGICNKLETRHPHVFDQDFIASGKQFDWEQQKHQERRQKSKQHQVSLLDDIPATMPELKRAQKMQLRVAKKGFDWPQVAMVWEKLQEESDEIKQAVEQKDRNHIEEEIGDLLFVCVNLARHYGVDADKALRIANKKFEKRFRDVERQADWQIENYSLEQLEIFWQQAKINLSD